MKKFLRTLMLAAAMILPLASHAQSDCTGLTLPYAENFDAYTGNATSTTAPTGYPSITLPDCWSFLNMSESTSTYPQAFLTSNTSYAVSGNCLFFKSSSSTPLYAILPSFGAQSGHWQLSFTYRNEGVTAANGTIIVGVMSDPTDATSFVAIETLERTTTKTPVEILIPAGSVTTNGRVAICYQGGTNNNYYASIDDLTLNVAPSCLRVSNLAVTAATANSVTLSWTDTMNTGAHYSVFNMAAVNPQVIATWLSGTTYTVTGLDANTAYEFGVSANCSDTDASAIMTISCRTDCGTVQALPYVEEFNGYTGFLAYPYYGPSTTPACWLYYSNGTNTVETNSTSAYYGGVASYNGTSYGSMESNNPYLYLPIQLTGSAVTSSTALDYDEARGNIRIAAMPPFAEALTSLQVSFDYKMGTAYSATGAAATLEFGYVYGEDITFVSMQSYQAVTTTQHVVDLNLSTLAVGAPAGSRLAFRFSGVHNGTSTSSYSNVACGIDNIVVTTLPTCLRATNLAASNITSHAVTLTWADTLNTG
ncbi:MAG: fibronectin type III domain-containing protein, partial [Bacteroidales bacterium]|nr:fibronectin type III domain-containing protein [Bacteroidales bacterium]